MNICLIDSHTLACEARRVVDGDIVQIRVLLPVLIQDEQKLLRTPQCKCWK